MLDDTLSPLLEDLRTATHFWVLPCKYYPNCSKHAFGSTIVYYGRYEDLSGS